MLDVCSITVTLIYTKYRAYDHLVMPIGTGIKDPKLWPGRRERAGGRDPSCSTRFVSRLVAAGFLDWTSSEREAGWSELVRWPWNFKSRASGKNACAPQLNGYIGSPEDESLCHNLPAIHTNSGCVVCDQHLHGTFKLHFRHAPRSSRSQITTGWWFAPWNFNSKLPLFSIS